MVFEPVFTEFEIGDWIQAEVFGGILTHILETDQYVIVRERNALPDDAEAGTGTDEFGLIDGLSILYELTHGSEKRYRNLPEIPLKTGKNSETYSILWINKCVMILLILNVMVLWNSEFWFRSMLKRPVFSAFQGARPKQYYMEGVRPDSSQREGNLRETPCPNTELKEL